MNTVSHTGEYFVIAITLGILLLTILSILLDYLEPAFYVKACKAFREKPKSFKRWLKAGAVLILLLFAIWGFQEFKVIESWDNLPVETQDFLKKAALILSGIIIIPWLLFFIFIYTISIVRGQLHAICAMEESWGGPGLILYLLLWVFLLPVMLVYALIWGLIMCSDTLREIKATPV